MKLINGAITTGWLALAFIASSASAQQNETDESDAQAPNAAIEEIVVTGVTQETRKVQYVLN